MIGIVILNYNTYTDVIECIDSIKANTSTTFMIYVVDNASTDDSYALLCEKYENEPLVQLLQSDNNGGYSYGNNIGIRKAVENGCDYILISNPDMIYYKDSIDLMYKDLQSDESIGVIGPSTASLDQDESQLLRKTYTPVLYLFSKKPFQYLGKKIKHLRTEYDYPNESIPMPWKFHGMVRGCCFMISSDLFTKICYFDDSVFLYSEEWIISKKIEELGFWCAYERRAKTLHKEATSTKKIGNGFQSYHLYLSAFYYIKYYTKASNGFLLFLFIQNIINFFLKSLRQKSYRKLLRRFVKKNWKLLSGIDKKIEIN